MGDPQVCSGAKPAQLLAAALHRRVATGALACLKSKLTHSASPSIVLVRDPWGPSRAATQAFVSLFCQRKTQSESSPVSKWSGRFRHIHKNLDRYLQPWSIFV